MLIPMVMCLVTTIMVREQNATSISPSYSKKKVKKTTAVAFTHPPIPINRRKMK